MLINRAKILVLGIYLALFVFAGGCMHRAPSKVTAPGSEKTMKTKVLETGAAAMQEKAPVDQIHTYVCGLHFYNGNMGRQVEAHHYCSHVNEDLIQCVIYDGNTKDAKLIGVEYIISEKVFRSLSEEEKKLWHSHHYETKSGMLIAPGLPDVAEVELMEELSTTYGKTFHLWQVDRGDQLPLGIPQLMMGFTADGQAKPEMSRNVERKFGISAAKKREQRKDIPWPDVVPGANAWEQGKVIQLEAVDKGKTEGTGNAGEQNRKRR